MQLGLIASRHRHAQAFLCFLLRALMAARAVAATWATAQAATANPARSLVAPASISGLAALGSSEKISSDSIRPGWGREGRCRGARQSRAVPVGGVLMRQVSDERTSVGFAVSGVIPAKRTRGCPDRLVSRRRTALPLNRTVHTQNARAPTAACLVAVLCGLQHMGVVISRTDVEGTACKAALTRRTQGIGRCAAQEAGTVE